VVPRRQRDRNGAGVALLVVIRITGLNLPRGHDSRFGLRLGLGVLARAGAVFSIVRRRPEPIPDQQRRPGFLARLMARPSPRIAFVTGLLLFAPGATFIAAVQVVATSDASVPLVWLPLIAYLGVAGAVLIVNGALGLAGVL
jgi:hypothetical protein